MQQQRTHPLASYMRARGISHDAMARTINAWHEQRNVPMRCCRSTITRWLCESRVVPTVWWHVLECLTDGGVKSAQLARYYGKRATPPRARGPRARAA